MVTIYRGLMAAYFIKIPVLISIRTDPAGHYEELSDKIQIPLLFPRADGCVFQTEGARDFFAPRLQQNSRIILNPINPKYIGVPKPEKRTKTVVQSGRLVDFKNQPMLIRAFVEVHRKHPEYDLKIYGGDSFDGTNGFSVCPFSDFPRFHAKPFGKLRLFDLFPFSNISRHRCSI